VIDHDGSVLSVYDKLHLVPFGEYCRFQDFNGKTRLRSAHQGFRRIHSGPAPQADGSAGRAAHAPLICYEAVFPATLHRAANAPAG